jgi:2-phospho-L-lactate guanylyltransferase
VDGIAVVTADPLAESIALGDRAHVLHDREQAGQSAAAELGLRHALAAGFERALLVPGDTPLLDAADVDALLRRCEHEPVSAAIVPDRHGTGTNALVLSPPDALAPAFGPGSRGRHEQLAREHGTSHRVETLPSLALDVDTPDDLAELSAVLDEHRGIAPRTRGALRQLGRSAFTGTRPEQTLEV